jgi:Fe-S oxidoreductase
MATLEEADSTRGRAHMLFEMLQGEALDGVWRNEHVKEALDLCLSCKACKAECPTNVDIATYRAEFLSHYYETERRPLHAYAFGMIDRWARIGSLTPRLANAVASAPGVNAVLRKLLHLAPQRELPRLAPRSFRRWAAGRGVPGSASVTDARDVILWADTFNNYFHPHTSQAAFDVLTHAGFRVAVPREALCCGRPLYDFGLLDHAKAYLRRILHALGPAIDAGCPIVVLEPSCASVFRDELRGLFPDDARADRLRRQTFLLSEFLEHHAPGYAPPRLQRKAVLHGHCHHQALMKMTDEESLLRKMGVELEPLDAGCCGMAGPFGFVADKYAVSQAIGERILLPAVRRTQQDTLIVSDGFSCREQILQATGRRAIHLADVMRLALP